MDRKRTPRTLIACRDFYVEDCMARGQSPSTGNSKRLLLDMFIRWCLPQGIRRLSHLDLDVLEDYREYLYLYRKAVDDEPLNLSTQRMRLMAITGMLKRLYNLGKLKSDFYKGFDLPHVKRQRLLDIPSEDDMELIFAQCMTRGQIGVRDRAILELCYASGIRRAELANLDLLDIDYRERQIKVRKGKGGMSRMVPVSQRALDAVSVYLREVRPEMADLESGEALFLGMTGKRIQKSALSELAALYIRRSGVSAKGACHILRHASASHMMRNGAGIRYIQDYLGHEHILSTQIYAHVVQEDLKRVYQATHPSALNRGP